MQRLAPKFLGALLLLCVWSLAAAAPPLEPTTMHALPARGHGVGATLAHLALPVLAISRLKTQPVALHEPRLAVEDFRDAARDVAEERSGNARSIVPQRPGEFAIVWRESREIVSPDVVSLVRNFRRNGLPIVHLYQSDRNLLAIGLNNHGMPGIYFTRHVAE